MLNQKRLFRKWLKISLLLLGCNTAAVAQLYPGDANNDGIVNNIDILYIGYAYGTYGPLRPNPTVAYAQVNVPLFWTQQFPDSTNFAFADSDGNGLINIADFLTVYNNYGNKHINPQPTDYVDGVVGIDAHLRLGAPQTAPSPTEGDSIEIPIYLEGPRGDTLENINGIAFSLEFDRRFFRTIRVDLEESWLNADSALFRFQNPVSNRIEVAVTRYGRDSVRGYGKIGTLRGIIEEDLIGLRPRDSIYVPIKANFIKLVDSYFRNVAVAGSQTGIMIFDSDSLVPTDEIPTEPTVQIFPNPSSGILQIRSSEAIQRIEIFNEMGQRLAQWQFNLAYTLGLSLANLSKGFVFVKIYTEKGMIIQKVIIRP